MIGKAKRSRLVVQSTSLEHPYQRSSHRCSEGRGGKIFFFVKSIHHVVGIPLPFLPFFRQKLVANALFPSFVVIETKGFCYKYILIHVNECKIAKAMPNITN